MSEAMKLLFCPKCEDVVRLHRKPRSCMCKKCGGYYQKDGLNAIIWGKPIPLGFENGSFIAALNNQPEEGLGARFDAFVIPKVCPTIAKSKVQH